MLTSRHGALGQTSGKATAWVCLSCRTKRHRRGQHTVADTNTTTDVVDGHGRPIVRRHMIGNRIKRPRVETHSWEKAKIGIPAVEYAEKIACLDIKSFAEHVHPSIGQELQIKFSKGRRLKAKVRDHKVAEGARRYDWTVGPKPSAFRKGSWMSINHEGFKFDIEAASDESIQRASGTGKGKGPASQELAFEQSDGSFLARKKLHNSRVGRHSEELLMAIDEQKSAIQDMEAARKNERAQVAANQESTVSSAAATARPTSSENDFAEQRILDRSSWGNIAVYQNPNHDFLGLVSRQCAQHATDKQRPCPALPRLSSYNLSRTWPMQSNVRHIFAWQTAQPAQQLRAYHSSHTHDLQVAPAESLDSFERSSANVDASTKPPDPISEKRGGIRAQLRQWQELHGREELMPDLPPEDDGPIDFETPYNSLTRLPNAQSMNQEAEKASEENDRIAFFSDNKEGFEGTSKEQSRFLEPGDLVELEFLHTERESVMAIYVRRVAKGTGQFLTLNGRWQHVNEGAIPFSVPGWINPKMLEPLLKYLPDPQNEADLKQLRLQSKTEYLDVPREVSSHLVARLQEFADEVRELYRRNASALDDAHNLLAHETDLRYGSVVSAAATLLNMPVSKLPLAALFTVRKALANGGFGFNIDRRSHRLTGYMQIRSKEQVRMVEQVRVWIRQWQEDSALKASMDAERARKYRSTKGAQIMYSFLEKSRRIIQRQRQNRDAVPESGNVGPSKTRLSLQMHKETVSVELGTEFTEEESQIVKLIEAWCCSNMFLGLTRIESLPPLILHALGVYPDSDLKMSIGYLFLQELGTIVPYENRVRFDQYLLLPSSQHSKPLQKLMTAVLGMRETPNFYDSMSDLRHDWKDLPVYCIDDASAKEIDDGLSIEDAGVGADGKQQQWMHIHIANPTAFFSRDHPLAKMARHMGETLYMPERTYMMLPQWSTARHFSLAPNRPCLTFSAKIDCDGHLLETKVRPGIIRNVFRVTYDEIQEVLGDGGRHVQPEKIILTVGGAPPPSRDHISDAGILADGNLSDIRKLRDLALARSAIRRRAGGIFFEQHHPDMRVWQGTRSPGLAWDHPHRKGSRTIRGDPIIQMQSQRLVNYFTASRENSQVLVSEAMLLCSEIAARYCADRNIPIIYRGTVDIALPGDEQPKEQQWKDFLAQGKDLPMHLGLPYLHSFGHTVLRTRPLKHAYLGMDYYAKVTSPLRRYGDMILHWQIEAALRYEASSGQSLLAQANDKNAKHDRTFLPFSTSALETIMVGLQPRETMITRAKRYSNDFWAAMLLFRMFHYKEGGAGPVPTSTDVSFAGALPPGEGGFPYETLTVFLPNSPDGARHDTLGGICLEMSVGVEMMKPGYVDSGMEQPMQGDVWEVGLERVDVYLRKIVCRPKRLVGRDAL